MGYLIQCDRKPYEPKKEVKLPYWAITDMGRIVLVTKHKSDDSTAEATVIKQHSPEDCYDVGYRMQNLSLSKTTPLADGESLVITNTWEIADG